MSALGLYAYTALQSCPLRLLACSTWYNRKKLAVHIKYCTATAERYHDSSLKLIELSEVQDMVGGFLSGSSAAAGVET